MPVHGGRERNTLTRARGAKGASGPRMSRTCGDGETGSGELKNGAGGQVYWKQFGASAWRRHGPREGCALRRGATTPVGCAGKARCGRGPGRPFVGKRARGRPVRQGLQVRPRQAPGTPRATRGAWPHAAGGVALPEGTGGKGPLRAWQCIIRHGRPICRVVGDVIVLHPRRPVSLKISPQIQIQILLQHTHSYVTHPPPAHTLPQRTPSYGTHPPTTQHHPRTHSTHPPTAHTLLQHTPSSSTPHLPSAHTLLQHTPSSSTHPPPAHNLSSESWCAARLISHRSNVARLPNEKSDSPPCTAYDPTLGGAPGGATAEFKYVDGQPLCSSVHSLSGSLAPCLDEAGCNCSVDGLSCVQDRQTWGVNRGERGHGGTKAVEPVPAGGPLSGKKILVDVHLTQQVRTPP